MMENTRIEKMELEKNEEIHFEKLELSDCSVPVGCPLGANCPEDAFPDHWK